MTEPDMSGQYSVVFGMGQTGFSCARFLAKQGIPFCVVDSRDIPPGLEKMKQEFPDIELYCGGKIPPSLLLNAHRVIASPGISPGDSCFDGLQPEQLIGDIELFFQYAKAPVVAVTGSNAKSSVTTLIGECVESAGKNVAVGGNLGVPALELLDDAVELYVLELSSFQLELINESAPEVAVFLNVCEDHLDRYESMADYVAAKQKIFTHAKAAVFNADDSDTVPLANIEKQYSFTAGVPVEQNQYGLLEEDSEIYLVKGSAQQKVCRGSDFELFGSHIYLNALAVLAVCDCLDLDRDPVLQKLKAFRGLPHRCQLVARHDDVVFIDDSKGTNVGATNAALKGLSKGKNIVLIAGGEGKGADFALLKENCRHYVKQIVLIGRDAQLMASVLSEDCETVFAQDMVDAVTLANQLASPGDVVLLSPACASFDMFKNFEHRGLAFSEAVGGLKQ